MKRMRVRVNDDWYDVEIADLFQNPVEVVVDGETYLVEVGNPGDAGVPARRSAPRKA